MTPRERLCIGVYNNKSIAEQSEYCVLYMPIYRSTAAHGTVIAAACWFFPGKPALYIGGSTSNPGADFYRLNRAIHGASAAFHTGVSVNDPRPLISYLENAVRADVNASPATVACFFVICNRRYIF